MDPGIIRHLRLKQIFPATIITKLIGDAYQLVRMFCPLKIPLGLLDVNSLMEGKPQDVERRISDRAKECAVEDKQAVVLLFPYPPKQMEGDTLSVLKTE